MLCSVGVGIEGGSRIPDRTGATIPKIGLRISPKSTGRLELAHQFRIIHTVFRRMENAKIEDVG